MKNHIIISILLIFSTLHVVSQTGEVHGKITDITNNEPVAFANVIVSGTQIGATSNEDGEFIISGMLESELL